MLLLVMKVSLINSGVLAHQRRKTARAEPHGNYSLSRVCQYLRTHVLPHVRTTLALDVQAPHLKSNKVTP